MRKLAQTSTALLLLSSTAAMAAGVDTRPEAQAYFRLGFAGHAKKALDLQYGFALQNNALVRAYNPGLPALAEVSFNREGFLKAWLNGVPFAQKVHLRQSEGEGEASSGGLTSDFTAIDWTLAGIGAVGVGFGIAKVVNQNDSPDPVPAPAPAPSPLPPSPIPLPPSPIPLPPLPLPLPVAGAAAAGAELIDSQWLDEGMGQMGDLILR